MINEEFKLELTTRLTHSQLDNKLTTLFDQVRGQYSKDVLHTASGNVYTIIGATVINMNGTAYYGVVYLPALHADDPFSAVSHVRPVHEFDDGRFEAYHVN